jgi:hypothetical protein
VLVMIDIFSCFLWCRPLMTKRGVELVRAIGSVFEEGRKPELLRTDRGSEFTNRDVQKYLKERDVGYITAYNETKANYAERVIKTLKHKIFRYILKHQNYRYTDVLQDLVTSYNHTVHRSLGATPDSITPDGEGESRFKQYQLRQKEQNVKTKKVISSRNKPTPYKYKMGELVRISHVRGAFDREYSQKWTGELFKVIKRYRRQGVPIYKIEDWNGEAVDGTFYEAELQPVHVDENTTYKIEKILKKRTLQKRKEVLVRWLHWPKKYDSWIPETEVRDYQ